jgi:hypothetical protein
MEELRMPMSEVIWQARSEPLSPGDSTLAFVPFLAGLASSSALLAGGGCRLRFGRLGIGRSRLDEKAESAAPRLERMIDSMPYGKDNA